MVSPPSMRAVIAALLLLPAGGGCVSHVARLEPVRLAFHRGDLVEAERLLARDAREHPEDASVIALDRATVALADGRPADAERLLRGVRDEFDRLEAADPTAGVMMLARDDVAADYPGEDHEKVLIRALLAVANLLQDGDDAEAYALQVAAKQREIVLAAAGDDGINPKASYPQVAFGSWLRGMLREATHRDYDDAARHFATVAGWQPDFRAGPAHQARAAGGLHSARGHGVVHVFALVGHGPFKAEVVEMPSSLGVMLAGDMLANGLGGALPPTIAPIKVPRVVVAPAAVAGLEVAPAGRPGERTETITDVSRMAVMQQEAVLPETVARAVVRRTLKKGTIFGAKRGLGLPDGTLPAFVMDAAGVAWEASERADTRCWSLLPDTIRTCRLELPVGDHDLTLRPLDRQGRPAGRGVIHPVHVADGRDTFVVVSVPEAGIIGRPLTGGR